MIPLNSGLEEVAPNRRRLLYAGSMAIFAAGVGFAIRGGILENWGREFGFGGAELGAIAGAGFTGFCFGIMIGGIIADKIGYGKLVIGAFAFHVLSAFITFAANASMGKEVAYNYLFWGTFLFAVANGTLEAVANPLVAMLYPENRTAYLNILHAAWPGGMIFGGAIGWLLGDKFHLSWKIQLSLFLLPTVAYGAMFFRQRFPKSEASRQGLRMGGMLKDVGLLGGAVACALISLFLKDSLHLNAGASYAVGTGLLIVLGVLTRFSLGSWLLFMLFIAHGLLGCVELGTDSWIQNIMGNILTSEAGKILFVLTSLTMLILRFSTRFVERILKLSPIALLLLCAVMVCIGLNIMSSVTSFTGALLALTFFAFGKAFLWPTMLAVTADRFPKTGAVAISIMGGIGYMSAGLLGSPGLGSAKDYFTGESLRASSPAIYSEYRSTTPSKFMFFDEVYRLDAEKLTHAKETPLGDRTPAIEAVITADQIGNRKTLKADAYIPAGMAIIYFGLVIYFRAVGGYKPVRLE